MISVCVLQIHCNSNSYDPLSGNSYFNGELISSKVTFNGQTIQPLETMSIGLYFAETTAQTDNGVVTDIFPTDRISIYSIGGLGDESSSESMVKEFPLNVGETKTYPIKANIKADYYTITNLINHKLAYLPPTFPFSATFGWTDDNTFQIYPRQDLPSDDGASVPMNNRVNMERITIADPDQMTLTYAIENLVRTSTPTPVPSNSPTSNYQVNFVRETRTWTGTTQIKVLENANDTYRIFVTITLADDTNTFVQTLDIRQQVIYSLNQ